jgi:HSP20 family protein
VLRLRIPVAERAKPRKISIGRGDGHRGGDEKPARHEVINA